MKSESLLFDPSSRKFCLLNETATCVWERLERRPPRASAGIHLCVGQMLARLEAEMIFTARVARIDFAREPNVDFFGVSE